MSKFSAPERAKDTVQAWFHDVVAYLTDLLQREQAFTCRLTAEDSDSVRFNGGVSSSMREDHTT